MTNKERLEHACPKCHAKAGDPCRHYNGEPTDRPHKTRGPGQLEAHLAAEAERTTARKRAPYGPLFADLAAAEVPVPTVDELKLRKRFEAARGVETGSLCSKPNRGLEWLRVWNVFRQTVDLIGEEWALKAWDRARKIYDTKESYIVDYFRKLLTEASAAKPFALDLEVRFDPKRVNEWNRDGRYLVDTWLFSPPAPIMAAIPAEPFTRGSPMTITTTQREEMGGLAFGSATLWDYFAAATAFPAALVEEVLSYYRNEGGCLPEPQTPGFEPAMNQLANREAYYRAKLASAMLFERGVHLEAIAERSKPKPAASARLSNVPAPIIAEDPFQPAEEPTGIDAAIAAWQAEAAAPAEPAAGDGPEDRKPGHPKAVLNASLALLAVLDTVFGRNDHRILTARAALEEAIRHDPQYNGPDVYEKHGKALYQLGTNMMKAIGNGDWPSVFCLPAVKEFADELRCTEGDFPF